MSRDDEPTFEFHPDPFQALRLVSLHAYLATETERALNEFAFAMCLLSDATLLKLPMNWTHIVRGLRYCERGEVIKL
jgi:hypothetical protein